MTDAHIPSDPRSASPQQTSQPDLQKRLGDLGIVPGGQSEEQVKAVFKNDCEVFTGAGAQAMIRK